MLNALNYCCRHCALLEPYWQCSSKFSLKMFFYPVSSKTTLRELVFKGVRPQAFCRMRQFSVLRVSGNPWKYVRVLVIQSYFSILVFFNTPSTISKSFISVWISHSSSSSKSGYDSFLWSFFEISFVFISLWRILTKNLHLRLLTDLIWNLFLNAHLNIFWFKFYLRFNTT